MDVLPKSANAVFPSAKPALVTSTSRYIHFDFVRRHKHILKYCEHPARLNFDIKN